VRGRRAARISGRQAGEQLVPAHGARAGAAAQRPVSTSRRAAQRHTQGLRPAFCDTGQPASRAAPLRRRAGARRDTHR
jgi:hypothetical protein